jgi:NAD+ kinase
MTFTIVARDDKASRTIGSQLSQSLTLLGHQQDHNHPDFVFFIGGDGTFLRAVQQYLHELDHPIFVGIHSGSLGFFCEYGKDELQRLIDDIPSFHHKKKTYALLEMHLQSKRPQTFYAVNEVRIEDPFQTLVTTVSIDDTQLETFRGTGLIVSSTLGSSAYNKSLGGSVVDGQIPTMQLTEMAAIQNNVYRSLGSSIVLHPARVLRFKGEFSSAIFGYDHQLYKPEEKIEEVVVKLSKKTLSIVHQQRHSYIETIHKTFVKN